MLSKLIDRIFHGGYEAANAASSQRVVARFARGNTSIQVGRYLDSKKMEKLRGDGDRAAAKLAKRARKACV